MPKALDFPKSWSVENKLKVTYATSQDRRGTSTGKTAALALAGVGLVALASSLGRRGQLGAVPKWWQRKHPSQKWQKVCYTSKTDALNVFRTHNQRIIDEWGGETAKGSGGEFDAINHKYGLKGKKAVTTIGEAIWAVMPAGRPYCLDRLDLEALNQTAPAADHPVGFKLPDFVEEQILEKEQERYWRSKGVPF